MANEIVLYQPNEQMSLEVKLENETVWLTLNQMASLFGRDKSVISRHIKAIFKERVDLRGKCCKKSNSSSSEYAVKAEAYSQQNVVFRDFFTKI
jgi:hypothetical protein